MAPRKKSGSALSKKSTLNLQSQPSKFGIQHFFERHTQNASSTSQNPKNVQTSQTTDTNNHSQDTPPANLPTATVASTITAKENSTEVSPEISKQVSLKRFKFSPGMLIKQSQDDGGDDVTWRISPVNERLQAVTRRMPEMIRVLADASRLNASNICHCSQKQACI
ncbi:hypothetical protein HHK36_028555 [Tetracentron sinense]|uniref:Uncharacterized protein n=1 Tax=Tetracentron sinense TaxID=13715 RepID=A0A834YFL2_TETSI|nr:hypothetical protein HHK36_028555 [Tetracentron sinense]